MQSFVVDLEVQLHKLLLHETKPQYLFSFLWGQSVKQIIVCNLAILDSMEDGYEVGNLEVATLPQTTFPCLLKLMGFFYKVLFVSCKQDLKKNEYGVRFVFILVTFYVELCSLCCPSKCTILIFSDILMFPFLKRFQKIWFKIRKQTFTNICYGSFLGVTTMLQVLYLLSSFTFVRDQMNCQQ